MEYERLRAQIVGALPRGISRGVGLGLLLREGVMAWMQAVRTASNPSSRAGAPSAPAPAARGGAIIAGALSPLAGIISPAHHDEVA